MYESKHEALPSKDTSFITYAEHQHAPKYSLTRASLVSGTEQRHIFRQRKDSPPIILSLYRDDDGLYILNLHDTHMYGEMLEEVYGSIIAARSAYSYVRRQVERSLRHKVFYLLEGLPKEED